MSLHADPPPAIVREPHGIQYQTADQLGKGGFAICYRAEQWENKRPTGKTVALKIVKSQMEPQKLAQKFVTELQLHSKLCHPNIVEFFRAFSFEKSTYVVLEICENGSLADALKKRKFFTMPEIRRFIIQTCGAVKYLHHRNIVHRDLKTGNLFLDSGMNIKVGDFGLAAVLVGKNDLGLRRTTMCGTPNYLAPEILEKGGKGHNEKVDLWAIGIIAYTLAVGKAPFHAAKREEIYKKLQNREYEWPDLSKHQNDISNNLRDLVGSLLVDEDDRPDPDQIVSHSFFKMAYIPEFLDSSCKSIKPSWANIRPPNAETIRRGYSDSWFKFCKISGVGIFAPGRFFPVIGVATLASVVKDVEREIKANKAPTVPIAAGTVYLPFITDRKDKGSRGSNNLSGIAEERESSGADSAHLIEISGNDRAARQKTESTKVLPPRRLKENVLPTSSPPVDELEVGANIRRARSTKGRMESKRAGSRDMAPAQTQRVPSDPARPSVKLVIERSETVQAQRRPRLPRANSTLKSAAVAQEEEVISEELEARPTTVVIPEPAARSPKQKKLMLERPVRSRTARPVTQTEQPAPTLSEKEEIRRREPVVLKEKYPELPLTDPASVLAQARQFRDSLLAAIQCKEKNMKMKKDLEQLPFVSKWVDYSKKHGVGYVLADGSVGCIFNATSRQPVTHVMVRNGYSYLKKRSNEPINISQIPLEFYSHGSKDAIRIVQLEGDRRRLNGILWAKFGNYMCQTLSGGENKRNPPGQPAEPEGLIVSYYQRLGTVGVWGFSNGCFQFNFPDHTKIGIAPDGKTCSFTCLQVDAMEYISQHGDLPMKYIRARETLSGAVQCLLHNSGERKAMMRANLLQEKIQFIADIADLWVTGGGLGCRPVGTHWPRWPGPHLEDAGGKKIDWITVGRYGGDLDQAPAE